jgi:hypothetical protein
MFPGHSSKTWRENEHRPRPATVGPPTATHQNFKPNKNQQIKKNKYSKPTNKRNSISELA